MKNLYFWLRVAITMYITVCPLAVGLTWLVDPDVANLIFTAWAYAGFAVAVVGAVVCVVWLVWAE